MKSPRTLIAIIVVLTVFSFTSLAYALVQRTQAIKSHEAAIEYENEARKQALMAQETQMLASQQRAIAEENARMAQAALDECSRKKKK